MEEGAGADSSMAPVAVPEVSVDAGQPAEGSAARHMAVPEEAVDVERHAKDSAVPMVVPEEAVGVERHAEGSAVPEEAADGDRRAEDSMVPMVVPEEAVDGNQRQEGSTVAMVVTEVAVDADQHVEESKVSMVVTEKAVDADQHREGVAAPTVVPEPAANADHHIENATTQDKPGDTDGIINVTPKEMRSIIEVIADTGKFWHEWSFLKRLLSLQLMQVLGEYSEVQMVIREDGQQQNSLSAETHSELFSQLNDALLRFEEGPPFTLQRLCEILLDPKGTYKKLSKLAWALEKTLLVTSTITKCTDPYPTPHGPDSEGAAITENTHPVDVEPEKLPEHPAAVSNGTQHAGGDGDEEMADAEADAAPGSQNDVEMQEEKPYQMADVNSGNTSSSAVVACETVGAASQQSPDSQS